MPDRSTMTGSRLLDPPQITLDAIYGDDTVLVPRPSPTRSDFVLARRSKSRADASTGAALTFAGSMPMVCSRQVTTKGCHDLLMAAGLSFSESIHPYETLDEYRAITQGPPEGTRFVLFYRHGPDEIPSEHYWIDPALLSFFNDKSKLHELVPEEFAPRRSVQGVESIARLEPSRATPVVIKGVSPWASGSGQAVIIARNGRDLMKANARFTGCDAVVVEEFLSLQRTWCLNFATDGSAIRYLGAAEEITHGSRYSGNWLEPDLGAPTPAREVGLEVLRRAAGMGYRGLAGIDMGLTETGRLVVLDLNFRLCGSTSSVVWFPSVLKGRSPRTMGRVGTLKCRHDFATASAAISDARAAWAALPLSCFEPSGRHGGRTHSRFRVLYLGDDRDEVDRNRTALEAACGHSG